MINNNTYPVIDIFAGPGGLGEGFSSLCRDRSGFPVFKTFLSIEKDTHAHATLKLRHFLRAFEKGIFPDQYYHYLEGRISLEDLYGKYPENFRKAEKTAWQCTLGEEPYENIKSRISETLGGCSKWVLVGGPPCQAYSLVGRARMMGWKDFDKDPRHFLYREYLRILADHSPPVFVMENVKGLLSAKINGESAIHLILKDLSFPCKAVGKKENNTRYRLYSLSEPGIKTDKDDPASFTVKAEKYGVPQARHRIFIVGVREDIKSSLGTLDKEAEVKICDVIGGMPLIRSGISRSEDSWDAWRSTLEKALMFPFSQDKEKQKKLQARAQKALDVLGNKTLYKSSRRYVPPGKMTKWFVDDRLKVFSSHEARSHMRSDLQRYFFASLYTQENGISPKLADFPEELLPNHKNVQLGRQGKMFSDRFRVQPAGKPSTTITSHISKDGHYFIHYDPVQCRSLTVREAARLQTFPDNYKFEGNRTAQYHQVGNAVPPYLAVKIAKIIADVLDKAEGGSNG